MEEIVGGINRREGEGRRKNKSGDNQTKGIFFTVKRCNIARRRHINFNDSVGPTVRVNLGARLLGLTRDPHHRILSIHIFFLKIRGYKIRLLRPWMYTTNYCRPFSVKKANQSLRKIKGLKQTMRVLPPSI
jgi:hypothetical protein